MAQRSFIDKNYTLVKKKVEIFAAVSVSATVPTLLKWNYPTFSGGPTARTYTAAQTGSVPTTTGAFPQQYQVGAEGVLSVTRTGTGLWTIRLQDNYQRCLQVMAQQLLAGGLGNIVATHQDATTTNMNSPGGSLVGIALCSSTATAADPTSGSTVLLTFIFQDATES
jgi:hypothetical protein